MVDTAVDIHQNITLFGGVGSTTTRGRIQEFKNKYGPDQVSSGAASSFADGGASTSGAATKSGDRELDPAQYITIFTQNMESLQVKDTAKIKELVREGIKQVNLRLDRPDIPDSDKATLRNGMSAILKQEKVGTAIGEHRNPLAFFSKSTTATEDVVATFLSECAPAKEAAADGAAAACSRC